MSFIDALGNLIGVTRDRTIGAFLEGLQKQKSKRNEATFSMALIALSAKMAKADGVVTEDEISAFKTFFDYPESEARNVKMLFDLAQQDVAGFDHYLIQVARLFEDEPVVLEDVLDCLFYVALADGVAHPREMALLEKAAEIFELPQGCFQRIKASHMGLGDNDPFAILGLSHDATQDQIKARYLDMIRDHHPDALIARGVPHSLIKIAEARAKAINAAYEMIQKMS
ncbi:MAG: TerB family tellurite resistance protein [Pseudomonadota bacterium]